MNREADCAESDVIGNCIDADSIGSADTHLHCVSNLDVKGLEHTFVKTLMGSGESRPVSLRRFRSAAHGQAELL